MGLFGSKKVEQQPNNVDQRVERRVHLAQTIQKIKDDIGTIKGQIDIQVTGINKTVSNHIEAEDKKLDKILVVASSCPEGPHIALQNGLIEDQKKELKEHGKEQIRQGKVQQRILGMMVFCGIVLSFLLGSIFLFTKDKSPEKDVKNLEHKIEDLIDKLK